MIKEVAGDILLTQAEAIAHGVAVDDDFKHGVGAQLKSNWPQMYKDFRHFCKTQSPKEGDVWAWKGPGGPVIFNLFTQSAPRTEGGIPGKASQTALHHALKNLNKELHEHSIKNLAITKIATGVGGLDWKEVKETLDNDMAHFSGNLFVYSTYKANQKAQEL
jgi:O-acetyl-ADP-ribose deacetylase (regulator of RNase III)